MAGPLCVLISAATPTAVATNHHFKVSWMSSVASDILAVQSVYESIVFRVKTKQEYWTDLRFL